MAVSDGMGGAHAGEVASALVVETITREIAGAPLETPRDATLTEAIQRAHEAVRVRGQRDRAKMGATLTAVFVRAGRAYIAEVGDSRAYLVNEHGCRILTEEPCRRLGSGEAAPQPIHERLTARDVVLLMSGRGDKDIFQVAKHLGVNL